MTAFSHNPLQAALRVAFSPGKTRVMLVLLMSAKALLALSYLVFIVVPPVSLNADDLTAALAAALKTSPKEASSSKQC